MRHFKIFNNKRSSGKTICFEGPRKICRLFLDMFKQKTRRYKILIRPDHGVEKLFSAVLFSCNNISSSLQGYDHEIQNSANKPRKEICHGSFKETPMQNYMQSLTPKKPRKGICNECSKRKISGKLHAKLHADSNTKNQQGTGKRDLRDLLRKPQRNIQGASFGGFFPVVSQEIVSEQIRSEFIHGKSFVEGILIYRNMRNANFFLKSKEIQMEKKTI